MAKQPKRFKYGLSSGEALLKRSSQANNWLI